jgi:3'(2'), 5'-bisphosphate nucleotidase
MLEAERETAVRLAYEAGSLARSIASGPLQVEGKGDQGPVTAVDREVDAFLRNELFRAFPDDVIVSEESTARPPDSGKRIWFVDPIDGTEELIQGIDEWSILIGLAQSRRAVLGVVYRPATEELYHGVRGEGAFLRSRAGARDQRLRVNKIRDPKSAILVQSRSHPSDKAARLADAIGIRKTVRLGSLGLKLAKIAEREADLYVNFSGKCHLWDLCASEVILREAGGDVRSLRSEPIHYEVERTVIRRPFAGAADGLIELVARASAGMRVDPP